jgi:uncharacterized protein YndB with AHSA1/START domain
MTTSSHKVTIDASKDKIFKAITTEQGLKGWYSPKVEGKTDKGGEVTLSFSEHEGPFRWKVAEAKPDSLVCWECVAGPGQATGTVATFRLSDKTDGRTVVELDHEGFKESDEKLKTCNTLWGGLIIHLKKYVETKKTEPAVVGQFPITRLIRSWRPVCGTRHLILNPGGDAGRKIAWRCNHD